MFFEGNSAVASEWTESASEDEVMSETTVPVKKKMYACFIMVINLWKENVLLTLLSLKSRHTYIDELSVPLAVNTNPLVWWK